MDPVQAVRDLVDPLLTEMGLDLYDLEVLPGVIRVLVDRDGGVDLDGVTAATTAISLALDAHDPVAGRYTLEVSSPGLERPLRRPEHFRRALGAAVKVKTMPGVAGERRVEGVLQDANEAGICVMTASGEGRALRYEEIERARSVFEWGPAPKPTGAPPRTKRSAKARGKAASMKDVRS